MPLFSTTDAHERGISDHDLATMVLRGLIWRAARGWYSSRMDATADERHVLRTAANLRLMGPSVIVNAVSAALLHGLPVARADLSVVEFAKTGTGHGRVRSGVRLTRLRVREDDCPTVPVPIIGGAARVVPPAAAVVGTALTTGRAAALVAGDAALRLGSCTRADLETALDRHRGCRGIDRARAVLPLLDGRHESPGETLLAVILRDSPWAYEPQLKVRANGRNYRLDFALTHHRVAIEFDGDIKYTGPEVMEKQLKREADLRAAGWTIVRFVWADLEDEGEVLRRLHRAIDRAQAAA